MSSRQQNSVEDIGERAMLHFFGRTDNLSKIQRMFALSFSYICENFQNGKVKDNTYFHKAFDDLDAAIEEKMPKSTSPDYNKYIAMKGISYNTRANVNFTSNREYTEKALALLEPIKLTPEGISNYLTSVVAFSHVTDDSQKVLAYLNDGMAAIDEFEKSGKESVQFAEIFGGSSLESSLTRSEWLNKQRNWLSIQLFNCHALLKNEKMMEKLIFPALKGIYRGELSMHSVLNEQDFKPEPTVSHLSHHIKYLLENHYFAQVNHLVSVLMFHLVKKGRTAGSTEEQRNIDIAKGKVCFWYAFWAVEALWYTYYMVTNPENSVVLGKPIRTEIVRFDLVVEPGVEIYENQFPVDVIESAKEWKNVIKKGEAWFKRGIDYKEKCTGIKVEDTPAGWFSFFKDKQIFT